MAELRIADTRHFAAVCGTGSNTLVADEAFAADHRILKFGNVLNAEEICHKKRLCMT
jgi:hypothetical protein